MIFFAQRLAILSLSLATISLSGCGAATDKPRAQEGAPTAAQAADAHSGWWCDEHGVPEEVCAQCDPKVAEAHKAKGDWCRDHDRPDSQCFLCHPEQAKGFAALYEAKVGHALPPRSDENMN